MRRKGKKGKKGKGAVQQQFIDLADSYSNMLMRLQGVASKLLELTEVEQIIKVFILFTNLFRNWSLAFQPTVLQNRCLGCW